MEQNTQENFLTPGLIEQVGWNPFLEELEVPAALKVTIVTTKSKSSSTTVYTDWTTHDNAQGRDVPISEGHQFISGSAVLLFHIKAKFTHRKTN